MKVNIKICWIKSWQVRYDGKQRNELLVQMTDDVAQLYWKTTTNKTQAISLAAWRSAEIFDEYTRFSNGARKS